MGTWTIQTGVSTLFRETEIPATPGGTYNSEPYYIGLLKNGALNTTEAISDFTITKQYDWIKNVQLTNSSNGNYCRLTYEVDENTGTSPRSCIITVNHKPANKNLSYSITQSANTTQEPTKPTVYDFTAVYTGINLDDAQSYSLKVNNYSVGSESGPFESIKAGDQSNSKQLNIPITMSNPYKTGTLQSNLVFEFEISCDGLESFNATINNDYGGGEKTVYIQHSQSNIGELKIESIRPGVVMSITIFRGGQMSITDQLQLSAVIAGNITINSDIIPFVVTFDFIN